MILDSHFTPTPQQVIPQRLTISTFKTAPESGHFPAPPGYNLDYCNSILTLASLFPPVQSQSILRVREDPSLFPPASAFLSPSEAKGVYDDLGAPS